MRKKFLLPLLMLCVGSFAVATGCNDDKDSSSAAPTATEITLSQESVQLEAYQEFLLTAIYEGDETVVWTVADPTIVSVENGKLVGLKAGTTTVTVTAGTLTDTCTVTVAPLDETKLSLQVAEANVSLYKNDQKQIETTIKYNGTVIDNDSEKSYASSDSNVVSVDENGKMTAKALGRATISVSCTISGVELGTSVNVEVISSGSVEIAQSSVTLDMTDANNQATLTAKAYEKGVENTGASIVWSATEGQDVIELVNGTVKAINAGETTVTATYVDNDGVASTDTVTVVVGPITVSVDNSIELWKDEYVEGYPVDELNVVDAEKVTGGYVVDGELTTALPFADGKYDVSSLSVGEMELYVETRNITYQITLTIFERMYLNNSNFKAKLTNADGATISGTFRLSEDITLDGTWANEAVFAGSLDGQGYTISGLNVLDGNGLFKATENATIKNVALVGVKLGAKSGAIAYVNGMGTTTLENVYVSLSSVAEESETSALIADNLPAAESELIIKNSVVYIPEGLTSVSAFVMNISNPNTKVTVENCTFIGENGKIVDGNTTGLTNTNSVICGRIDAHKTYKTNWSTMQINVYGKEFKYIELTQANFATYITREGTITGYYALLEDIDLSKTDYTYYGVNNTFKGTLDGNGYTISGIKTTEWGKGGLFATLAGTVKNVSIKGEQSKGTGLIANLCKDLATIENVYVETTLTNNGDGAIARQCTSLTMKNVVIKVAKSGTITPGAVFSYTGQSTLPTIENCYYIAENGMTPLRDKWTSTGKYWHMANEGDKEVFGTAAENGNVTTYTKTGTDEETGAETTTVTLTAYTGETVDAAKAAFDAAVTAGTVTLSDEVKAMMYPASSNETEN